MRALQHLDWENWLYGLWAAVIGGGSTAASGAIAVISVDPMDFNLGTSKFWKVSAVMFLTGAATSFFMFLKQNPAPKIIEQTKVTVTTTTTGTGDGK